MPWFLAPVESDRFDLLSCCVGKKDEAERPVSCRWVKFLKTKRMTVEENEKMLGCACAIDVESYEKRAKNVADRWGSYGWNNGSAIVETEGEAYFRWLQKRSLCVVG